MTCTCLEIAKIGRKCRKISQIFSISKKKGGQSGNSVCRYDVPADIELDWSSHALIPEGSYVARDLWAHQDLDGAVAVPGDVYAGRLAPHDNWAFRLTPA